MEILSSRMLVRPRDRAASLAFYRDALGLAVAREFPGGTVFFLGAGLLEVSGAHGGETVGAAGPETALWLQVRSLPEAVDGLRAAGVAVVREPRREPWGLDECWIADPDGRPIVLVEVPVGHPIRTDRR